MWRPGGGGRGVVSKFRKKPVVVEAIQAEFPRPNGPDGAQQLWPEELGALPFASEGAQYTLWDVESGAGSVQIYNPEDWYTVRPGDWIIKSTDGEFHPEDPDIFAQTYEPCDE